MPFGIHKPIYALQACTQTSVIFQAMKGKGHSNNCSNFGGNASKKQKLKHDSFEEKRKTMQVNQIGIDQIFLRFPHLIKEICSVLDEKSLADFTSAGRETVDTLNRRFFWLRKIQKQLGNSEKFLKDWSQVVRRCPVETLEEISNMIGIFSNFSAQFCIEKCSPLHFAVGCGNLRMCNYIIARIKDKNPKGGETPLHWSANRGQYEISKLILEHCTDKNPKDKKGKTPLHAAVRIGHLDLDLVKLIIKNTEDKNPADVDGVTPLHVAARIGEFDLVNLIIKNAEDKNPADGEGITPLHKAASTGNIEVWKLIIEHVRDENPRDHSGMTPLHYAASHGHINICKKIINKLANKNPRDNMFKTPLHDAARYGHFEVVKFIMEYIDIKNPMDQEGYTPLHEAARGGHFEVFQYIIDRTVDKSPVDVSGNTPLHEAAAEGYLNVCMLMMNEDLDNFNTRNNDGKTPDDLAGMDICKYIWDIFSSS